MSLWPVTTKFDPDGNEYETLDRNEFFILENLPTDSGMSVVVVTQRSDDLFIRENDDPQLDEFRNYVLAIIEETKDDLLIDVPSSIQISRGWDFHQVAKTFSVRLQARAARESASGSVNSFSLNSQDRSALYSKIDEIRLIIQDLKVSDIRKFSMLKKLDKFASEAAKDIGSMGYYTGLVVEASAAAGQTGVNTKPLFDRLREAGEIVSKGVKDIVAIGKEDRMMLPAPDGEVDQTNQNDGDEC